jgi:hypothetical protein
METKLLLAFKVPGAGCRSSGAAVSNCATQTRVYTPTQSSTARSLNQRFSIAYGTGYLSILCEKLLIFYVCV